MPTEDLSLDELNCIMNLQRQEAFDDSGKRLSAKIDNESAEDKLKKILEAPVPAKPRNHDAFARRAQSARKSGSLSGRYLSASMSDLGSVTDDLSSNEKQQPKEKRRISRTQSNTVSALVSPKPHDGRRASSSSRHRPGRPPSDNKRGSYTGSTKRSSSSRSLSLSMDMGSVSSNDTGSRRDKRPSKSNRHSSREPPPVNISVSSDGLVERKPRRSSGVTLSSQGSKDSRDGSRSRSTHDSKDKSKSRQSPSRSVISVSSLETPKNDLDMSVSSIGTGKSFSSVERRNSSARRQGRRDSSTRKERERSTSVKGRRESIKKQSSRRRMSNNSEGKDRARSRSATRNPPETSDEKKFEQLWSSSPSRPSKNGVPVIGADELVAGTTFSTIRRVLTGDSSKRKTKLEKIHELQAKCDRYKKEWIDASKEKKRYRKEVQDAQLDVVSLTKEIEIHVAEITILRKQLTGALEKLDETEEEQRKERNEYSSTAKELAQSRIDYTKSLNETRELQTDMDKLEATLKEKDARIESLVQQLQDTKNQVDDLTLDLQHADDEAIKLEREIKQIKEEITLYQEAAEKDEDGGAENLRKVRNDMEQRMYEEREKRLEDKQKKLDEKLKVFEEEREKSLQRQKSREQDFSEKQAEESEKQKEREDKRREMDDVIHKRLKELEDNNTVLQGKLKSGQLESSIKIQKRDETIKNLETNLTEVKKQLAERDADPEGIVTLQRDVASAKAEASAVREDLAEAQRLNGMLEEEIEDLQAGSSQLRNEVSNFHNEASSSKTEIDKLKKKVEEWQNKSSEWTDKGTSQDICSVFSVFILLQPFLHTFVILKSLFMEGKSRILGKDCKRNRSVLQGGRNECNTTES